MTEPQSPLIHRGFIAMDEIPAGVDLVEQVRALNAAGVDVPWMWSLSGTRVDLTSTAAPMLTFGVNNTVGILEWQEGTSTFTPAGGANEERLSYWLAGFHETEVERYTEVPVDLVFAAVAEHLQTRERPTCVDWRASTS
ncbi:hypothetical protein JOD54_006396 [Actinokineospora baliensis]|uniref:Imm1 family immunity protein n=1 Tax=Actinokineospora baliensis TaxID=547056 RepID=UPI00195ED892|nr:Imm1 family immunity protein [Actinokineospora baliensis]MBM7776192.1 hypothetical protein [Actinokineospora baliensis]